MDEQHIGKPLWRKVADFPLVTMVIAGAAFIGSAVLAQLIQGQLPSLSSPLRESVSFIIALATALIAYKLVIARIGEQPRDDLPWRGSARKLVPGC